MIFYPSRNFGLVEAVASVVVVLHNPWITVAQGTVIHRVAAARSKQTSWWRAGPADIDLNVTSAITPHHCLAGARGSKRGPQPERGVRWRANR